MHSIALRTFLGCRSLVLLPVVLGLMALLTAACGGGEREVVREVPVIQTVTVEKVVKEEVVKEVVKEVPVIQTVTVEKVVVATPEPGMMVPATGTIPGSVLRVALQRAGRPIAATKGDPFDGCRPGCNIVKDDIFLLDKEGQLQPHVVKSWEFGSDTMSWTLNMQEDIVFQSGRNATAEDLAWSILDDQWGPGARKSAQAYAEPYQLQTREIPSKYVLKIDFEVPTVASPQMSLTINAEHTGLFPSVEILRDGWESITENPKGGLSGAYQVVKEIPDEQNEYEVNVDWWKKPAPDWERVILRGIAEPASRLALMETGGVDVIALTALTLPQAEKIPGSHIITQPFTVMTQIGFSNTFLPEDPGYDADWPFNDVRVREAFNIAVDRQKIIDRVYGGLSIAQSAPMLAPGVMGWSHPTAKALRDDPIPFDPARAKQLLEEANFDFGMELKLVNWDVWRTIDIGHVNEAVMIQLRDNLGLNVTLDSANFSEHGPASNAHEKVPWALHGGTRNSSEPLMTGTANYFRTLYNVAAYPGIQEFRLKILGSTDTAEIEKQSAELAKHMRDNWVYMPMTVNPIFYGALEDRVKDWPLTVGVTWPHYFEYIQASDAMRK